MGEDRRRTLLLIAIAAVAALLCVRILGAAPATSAPANADARPLTAEARAAGFRFAPGTAPADRAAFEAAVRNARPEARRLIELVDGLVSVSVGPAVAGAVGHTAAGRDGYAVVVDFGAVWGQHGQRGVDRLVLHELAHVVDFALLGEEVRRTLDAGIPAGWGCDEGHSGGCAAREERFAESFAKWATGDIGIDLSLGYKVPPPSLPLEDWGRPLAALAADGA